MPSTTSSRRTPKRAPSPENSSPPRKHCYHAVQAGVVSDGQAWIDMLEMRNLLSHTYDNNAFLEAIETIEKKHVKTLERLHQWLKNQPVTGGLD
ncbi:MAG: hypothetical protein GC154_17055 [bacterium]|nr:hypothetical protein [bacterium]